MTSPARRPLIAGNWKLHRDVQESVELARAVSDGSRIGPRTDVVVAPVFTALHAVAQALRGTRVQVSAQDVYWEKQGAFTGEVSAPMLRDVGCTYCIVGHSERRQFFGETDANVFKKCLALQAVGITPIACLGETLAERESGITYDVVLGQLEGMIEGFTATATCARRARRSRTSPCGPSARAARRRAPTPSSPTGTSATACARCTATLQTACGSSTAAA